MTEEEWHEEVEKILHESERGDWNKIISEAVDVHRRARLRPHRRNQEVEEILHGLIRKMEGFPPPWVVIAGPDGDIKTPDDLWVHAAWNVVEVQMLWDLHDGRSLGTLVVGVYVWKMESRAWERDLSWGIMGHEDRRGYAIPTDPGDRLCD